MSLVDFIFTVLSIVSNTSIFHESCRQIDCSAYVGSMASEILFIDKNIGPISRAA